MNLQSLFKPSNTASRKGAAIALTSLLLLHASPGALVINAVESGGDVTISTVAGGSIDLGGLTAFPSTASEFGFAGLAPQQPLLALGGPVGAPLDLYQDQVSLSIWDRPFGSGGGRVADTVTGTPIVLTSTSVLVPLGYSSSSPLQGVSSATFTSTDFDTLGLTPGTYTATLPNDTITFNVGPVASSVPEPTSSLAFGMLALGFLVRRKR